MSMRADYVKERLGYETIEHGMGYAEYTYINENQVYIIDIYVRAEARRANIAALLADEICAQAKARGCKELIGTVKPSTRGSTDSTKVLLAYGMSLKSSSDDVIIFTKEL